MSYLIYQEKLRQLFLSLISYDKEIDVIRSLLFYPKDFTINGLFTSIDTESKQYICLNDLKVFLTRQQVTYEDELLRRVIHFYENNSFCIPYENFTKMITPRYTHTALSSQEKFNKNENLSRDERFVQLLIEEMNLCKKLGEAARDVKDTKDFTTYEGFIGITRGDKYITKENLKNFLIENKNDNEIECLIYRIDNNNNGQISYEKFQDLFFPFQSHLQKEEIEKGNYHKEDPSIQDTYYSSDIIRCIDISPKSDQIDINEFQKVKEELKKEEEEEGENEEEEIEEENECNDDIKVNSCELPQQTYTINTLTTSNNENIKSSRNDKLSYSYSSSSKQVQTPLITSTYQVLSHSKISSIPPSKSSSSYRMNQDSFIMQKRTEYSITISLIDYITHLISLETSAETLKESLALQQDISFPDLFYYFDVSKTNTITISDIVSICKSFAFFPTVEEIKLLFLRFSSRYIDELSFSEFAYMISPLKSEYRKLISSHTISDEYLADFSYQSKEIIGSLIKHMILEEKYLEEERRKINTKRNFSCIDSWGILTRYCKKHKEIITKEEIKMFLSDNGFFVTNFELETLCNKFDWDKDGQINYYDFSKEILGRKRK